MVLLDADSATVAELKAYCEENNLTLTGTGSGNKGNYVKKDWEARVKKHQEENPSGKTPTMTNKKDEKKPMYVKPRTTLAIPPILGSDDHKQYRLWLMLLEDWEEKSLKDNHNEGDLYQKMIDNMQAKEKEKYMTTHMNKTDRTYQTLKAYVGRKHTAAAEAMAEADRARFQGFVRGNRTLQEGREEWEALRSSALSSGGIENEDRHWKDLLSALQLGTKRNAEIYRELDKQGLAEGQKLEALTELLGYDERAYAKADAQKSVKAELEGGKKKKDDTAALAEKTKKEKEEDCAWGDAKGKPKGKKGKPKGKGGGAKGAPKGKDQDRGRGAEKGSWGSAQRSQSTPWSGKGKKGGGKGQSPERTGTGFRPPCRDGRDCTRPDCHFWHPGRGPGKGATAYWGDQGEWQESWEEQPSEESAYWGDAKGKKGKNQKGQAPTQGKGWSSAWLPGDWACPGCGDHQFAKNWSCRSCGKPKPQ